MRRFFVTVLLALSLAGPAAAQTVRIKDLVQFEGVRGNDLVGYGLVVGLDGTGDSIRNAPFTEEIMQNVLERLGVNITGETFRPRNVAAVLVTANLPPFARAGRPIDVGVSAIGDAGSLAGGTLVMTPLKAADGLIYAVAQGTVIAGGRTVEADAASVTSGVPTAGSIPNGARVEREVPFVFEDGATLRIALNEPDFTMATRIEAALNGYFGAPVAELMDPGTLVFHPGRSGLHSMTRAIAEIENLRIAPAKRARVVVDQRTGTVVLGEDVRIGRVAISSGSLVLQVEERPEVIQPNPFSAGQTIVVPRSTVGIDQPEASFAEIGGGASLSDVIAGLNALGVSTDTMIDILGAVHAAGALHADLIVR